MRTLAKVVAALSLMATLIWLYVDPGWEPAAAGLGALVALLVLFVSDRKQGRGDHPETSALAQDDLGRVDNSGLATLTGEVRVHATREDVYEVYYSRPFVRPPNLAVYSSDLLIVEQRADGFKVRGRSHLESANWKAEGTLVHGHHQTTDP